MKFEKIDICDVNDSFVHLIRDDWALLTAGEKGNYNTMTVSWGMLGELWGKDVVTVFVRPQRYTYEFMEKYDNFTLSFFGSEYRRALSFCGSKSGRDFDKAEECGLTAFETGESVAFEEAKLIIACRKTAFADMDPSKFIALMTRSSPFSFFLRASSQKSARLFHLSIARSGNSAYR